MHAVWPEPETTSPPPTLNGARIALLGKLAGMPKREAQQLIRQHGGVSLDQPDASADWIVVGEAELLVGSEVADQLLDDATRAAAESGRLQIITETQLWQRLGLVDGQQAVHRLYTPAMLADLLGVPVSIVRRWQRRGLIVPAREVRRLAYFDFQEVATARRLAELLAAGISPQALEKKLAALSRYLPEVERPLAQLSIIVEGKQILLRQGDGLLAPGGQFWFDFDAAGDSARRESIASEKSFSAARSHSTSDVPEESLLAEPLPTSLDQLLALAADLEDAGQLEIAADTYRTALVAAGPSADVCFRLAELLYRMSDLTAARERYYMAIELDENFVEARANLGCLLAELGQRELAIAAFEGALAYHGDYPDAHYHLARLLDDADCASQADEHWRQFVRLSPESPWAAEARARLALDDEDSAAED